MNTIEYQRGRHEAVSLGEFLMIHGFFARFVSSAITLSYLLAIPGIADAKPPVFSFQKRSALKLALAEHVAGSVHPFADVPVPLPAGGVSPDETRAILADAQKRMGKENFPAVSFTKGELSVNG